MRFMRTVIKCNIKKFMSTPPRKDMILHQMQLTIKQSALTELKDSNVDYLRY